MPEVTAANLKQVLRAQVDRKSYLMTDESGVYVAVGREFSGHGTVNHSIEEYVRGGFWHINTVEGYFSILKRGVTASRSSTPSMRGPGRGSPTARSTSAVARCSPMSGWPTRPFGCRAI
jgi:hypothetical protein